MATEVILPRVDMDMTEGTIAFWYVKNGDAVTKGQVLFDIETDKATMEVDAPVAGVFDGRRGEIGAALPVGQVVGWILAEGESLPLDASTRPADAPCADAPADVVAVAAPVQVPIQGASHASLQEKRDLLRATPLARSLAREQGIDLGGLRGSGPGGRIVAADLPARGRPAAAHIGHVHLHWWQTGSAAPVVLLHGFGADHAGWRPLVQRLPPGVPVLGIDLPNHGKSDRLPVDGFDDLARAVLRRLEQEGVEQFHLVGHSLGGGTAVAVAGLAAERVGSLTLLAPAGFGSEVNPAFIDGLLAGADETPLSRTLALLVHDPRSVSASFVATAARQLSAPGRGEALAALAQALMPAGRQVATTSRAVLDALRMPVKVVWGRADRIIPASQATDLPGRVALHLLSDVGHLPHVEATDLVADLLGQQVRAAAAGA